MTTWSASKGAKATPHLSLVLACLVLVTGASARDTAQARGPLVDVAQNLLEEREETIIHCNHKHEEEACNAHIHGLERCFWCNSEDFSPDRLRCMNKNQANAHEAQCEFTESIPVAEESTFKDKEIVCKGLDEPSCKGVKSGAFNAMDCFWCEEGCQRTAMLLRMPSARKECKLFTPEVCAAKSKQWGAECRDKDPVPKARCTQKKDEDSCLFEAADACSWCKMHKGERKGTEECFPDHMVSSYAHDKGLKCKFRNEHGKVESNPGPIGDKDDVDLDADSNAMVDSSGDDVTTSSPLLDASTTGSSEAPITIGRVDDIKKVVRLDVRKDTGSKTKTLVVFQGKKGFFSHGTKPKHIKETHHTSANRIMLSQLTSSSGHNEVSTAGFKKGFYTVLLCEMPKVRSGVHTEILRKCSSQAVFELGADVPGDEDGEYDSESDAGFEILNKGAKFCPETDAGKALEVRHKAGDAQLYIIYKAGDLMTYKRTIKKSRKVVDKLSLVGFRDGHYVVKLCNVKMECKPDAVREFQVGCHAG